MIRWDVKAEIVGDVGGTQLCPQHASFVVLQQEALDDGWDDVIEVRVRGID